MVESADKTQEQEKFLGLTTLQVARLIVSEDPKIKTVFLRAYTYVPDKPTEEGSEPCLPLLREDFLGGEAVDNFIEGFDHEWNISLDSHMEFEDGRKGHFPMLDMGPRKSEESLEKVKRRLKEIVVPHFGGGVLLETKKSYHYLGYTPFSEDRYQEFLGRSLITSIVTVTPEDIPNEHELIVDYRYIGHSLIRGSTGLRISAKGTKTMLPKVIATI